LNLTTVLFDMDGLLFDTEKLYYRANQAAADEMGLPFSWDYFLQFVGSSEYALYESLIEKFGDEKTARRFILRSEQFALEYMMNEPIPKKKGVEELLSFLKEKEVKMVVGSNSQRKVIELMLQRSNLSSYFLEYVGVDEVPSGKPSPHIYMKALEKAEGIPSKSLVLDDSSNGVRAAHLAGIPAFLVPDLEEPTVEVEKIVKGIYPNLLEVKRRIKEQFFNE